ncbi:MAG: pyrimidine 5'-nucleotidase, partial [Alphaproteobacteria bacterium]|nr:pyrimidine 5'-nucleotidase [Alphaproteobacteria bacterium]
MKPFNAIDTWIFDLDNTLYAPQHNLFTQIDKRMT